MHYSCLHWNHLSPTEPVEILSEYDDNGWEQRKIEKFRDGSFGFAGGNESVGGTQLSLIQRPPDEEVVAEPEFRVTALSKDEFEGVWAEVHRTPKLRRVS